VRADERRQDVLGQERLRVHEPRRHDLAVVDPQHRLRVQAQLEDAHALAPEVPFAGHLARQNEFVGADGEAKLFAEFTPRRLSRLLAPADSATRPGRVGPVGLLHGEDATVEPDRHHRAVVVRAAQPPPQPREAEADPVGEAPRPVHDHQAPLRVPTRRPHVFGAWACIGAASIVLRVPSAALLERTKLGEVPP
jgi:hypothetical protein